MKLMNLLSIIAGLFLLYVVQAMLFCPYCNSKQASMRSACLSNLKQQALALRLYGDEHEGTFPDRDFWKESILPYVREERVLHDVGPRVESVYGYAFNSKLSRAKEPRNPERVPLVFDSLNPTRNASDPVISLPNPGRHGGRNNISYADGHVRSEKRVGQP